MDLVDILLESDHKSVVAVDLCFRALNEKLAQQALYDYTQLICESTVVPVEGMPDEQTLNASVGFTVEDPEGNVTYMCNKKNARHGECPCRLTIMKDEDLNGEKTPAFIKHWTANNIFDLVNYIPQSIRDHGKFLVYMRK